MRTRSQARGGSPIDDALARDAAIERAFEAPSVVVPATDGAGRGDEKDPRLPPNDEAETDPAGLAEDFARAPTMGAFDRIVDGFYSVDVEREFADLEDKLALGRAAEAEHSILVNELDLASERAWRAHRLYVNACAALEGYELDAALVESDMRAQAIAVLRSEREAKIRTKDVTEKDVDSQMMRMFPDQVRASRVGREKAKRAVEHLKKFAELWAARQQALDAIVRTSRR